MLMILRQRRRHNGRVTRYQIAGKQRGFVAARAGANLGRNAFRSSSGSSAAAVPVTVAQLFAFSFAAQFFPRHFPHFRSSSIIRAVSISSRNLLPVRKTARNVAYSAYSRDNARKRVPSAISHTATPETSSWRSCRASSLATIEALHRRKLPCKSGVLLLRSEAVAQNIQAFVIPVT